MYQNPCAANIGHLVVMSATAMIASSGMTARRVSSPNNTRLPQTISKIPTSGPSTSGAGRPDLQKTTGTKLIGKEQLLDTLRQKDRTDHPSNQDDRVRCATA